jgi:hypothetical protein
MRKRLLCIAPDDAHTAALMTGPIHDWDTCCVDNLADADRVLRADGYPVGLLLRTRALLRSFDLDGFLRRHRDTAWIGVFRPHDVDHAACRDLIVEHLADYHTEPVDPRRLAWTLGHERIVTVDGQVVARSELRLGDLGRLIAGQAVPRADSLATVVQNSQNDRAIGTATIIHASVATQGLLQTMHFQSTLANAINAAAAGR